MFILQSNELFIEFFYSNFLNYYLRLNCLILIIVNNLIISL